MWDGDDLLSVTPAPPNAPMLKSFLIFRSSVEFFHLADNLGFKNGGATQKCIDIFKKLSMPPTRPAAPSAASLPSLPLPPVNLSSGEKLEKRFSKRLAKGRGSDFGEKNSWI